MHATVEIKQQIIQCEKEFIYLIRARLGIIIKSYQLTDLHKTILQACYKFSCQPKEYLQALVSCKSDSELLEFLVEGITIGETYFFRDKHQMNLLKEKILPALIQEKRINNQLSLRIWSAGCASGEEIYTVAMLLNEMLDDFELWRLQLLGTDINTVALQKALSGVYTSWSMRSISDYFKFTYFTHQDKDYLIHQKIKCLVNFLYLNLNEDSYPSLFNGTHAQDLILCRNVLIYFDTEHVEKVMRKMNACLNEGGYLLLGASDPISTQGTTFESHDQEGALLSHAKPQAIRSKSTVMMSEKQLRVQNIKSSIMVQAAANKKVPIRVEVTESTITDLLSGSKWQEVLEVVDQALAKSNKQAYLFNAKAFALANLGRLEEALQICHASLQLNATDAQTHYILAMTYLELNQVPAAEAALRKTLFLDYQFVIGHFQLGLLLLKNKQNAAGVKCLRNALRIVCRENAEKSVPGSPNLNYGQLAVILRREIELYV